MGKIVKYCSTCEEGFSEKFSFCPNCATELTAYEMKPVAERPEVSESVEIEESPFALANETMADVNASDTNAEISESEGDILEFDNSANDIEEPLEIRDESGAYDETVFEPVSFEADGESDEEDLMIEEFGNEPGDEVAEVSKPEKVAVVRASTAPVTTLFGTDGIPEADKTSGYIYSSRIDDDYGVTVINEGSGSLRKKLLLGASALVLTAVFGSVLWSVFNHPFFVAAIDDEGFLPAIIELTPTQIEEEPPKKANDKDSGGGGGGGTERDKPASQGELPSQTRDRIPPPMPVERLTNPSLVVINKTEGDIVRKRNDRMGIPDGLSGDISGGTGSGGGFGSGRGTGVGSGRGTGEGSGIGSGSGSGVGDGNGPGTGSGRTRTVEPPKPQPAGPTTSIKILSKPRPGYTDEARQNNVQGTVMLKVTFMSNGSVGGVSSIKGLPYGLTEKAIAAARQINFTPAMRNGQPYSVTKTIQYNFTIY